MNNEKPVHVVISTPVGDWHVQVRGLPVKRSSEAALEWVLKRDPRFSREQLRVL
jgi:hypothetical protein